jgi:hypothetical protein
VFTQASVLRERGSGFGFVVADCGLEGEPDAFFNGRQSTPRICLVGLRLNSHNSRSVSRVAFGFLALNFKL